MTLNNPQMIDPPFKDKAISLKICFLSRGETSIELKKDYILLHRVQLSPEIFFLRGGGLLLAFVDKEISRHYISYFLM